MPFKNIADKRKWYLIGGLMLLLFSIGLTANGAFAQMLSDGTAHSAIPSRPHAAFTPGNLVIYRVGDGSATLVATSTLVFLDEYTPAGVLVQSIPVPTVTSGANRRLVASGSASSEGLITRSTDGNYVLITGYDAAVGTGGVATSSSAAVNRVIGRVDTSGNIDTSTALTDAATGSNPRSAVSTNGSDIWMTGGAGGIRYTTLGMTNSLQLSTTTTNLRQTNIFSGQLYVSSASGAIRLATVGTGTPITNGQTITNLPGFPTSGGSPYGFYFADLSAGVAGLDTVYVADDGGTLAKYSLQVSNTWTLNNTIIIANVRSLTGVTVGTTVTLYAASSASTGAGGLFTFSDTSGYNVNMSGTATSLVTAAANTAFRGVAFAPGAVVPPTNTPSNTPVPPTNTPTNTPVPPTNTPAPPTNTPTPTCPPVTEPVTIVDSAFQPATITIYEGTTIQWTNNGSRQHTSTSDVSTWDSGLIGPGSSFSFTFNSAGTYSYHCNVHPAEMTGTITVLAGCPPPTATSTPTITNTPTVTSTPETFLTGHVTWQGRPAQPHPLQSLPITLTVKNGTFEENITGLTTDENGSFTARIQRSTDDGRSWRVKGPQFLANSGAFNLAPGQYQVSVEMGTMRTGDCNNDNVVNIQDMAVLRSSYGKSLGEPGYDARADLNGDNIVGILDYNLFKPNFGAGGSPPLLPGRR